MMPQCCTDSAVYLGLGVYTSCSRPEAKLDCLPAWPPPAPLNTHLVPGCSSLAPAWLLALPLPHIQGPALSPQPQMQPGQVKVQSTVLATQATPPRAPFLHSHCHPGLTLRWPPWSWGLSKNWILTSLSDQAPRWKAHTDLQSPPKSDSAPSLPLDTALTSLSCVHLSPVPKLLLSPSPGPTPSPSFDVLGICVYQLMCFLMLSLNLIQLKGNLFTVHDLKVNKTKRRKLSGSEISRENAVNILSHSLPDFNPCM